MSAGSRSGTYPTRRGRSATTPVVGRVRPHTIFNRVDLPEPFPPITLVTEPGGRSTVIPSSTQAARRP